MSRTIGWIPIVAIYLAALGLVEPGREVCHIAKEGYRLCAGSGMTNFRYVYAQYGDGSIRTEGRVRLGPENTGPVIPVTRELCHWPASMAEGHSFPTYFNETMPEWVASERWRHKGILGQYVNPNVKFSYSYVCGANCQNLTNVPSNSTMLIYLGTVSSVSQSWLTQMAAVSQANWPWCVTRVSTSSFQTSLMSVCAVLLGVNGQTGQNCPISHVFWSQFINTVTRNDIGLLLPLWGSQTSNNRLQCQGIYDANFTFSNTTVSSNCKTAASLGSAQYPLSGPNCTVSTPAQMWQFSQTGIQGRPMIKYLLGEWPPISSQISVDVLLSWYSGLWTKQGNDILGYSAGSSCKIIETSNLTECVDMVWFSGDLSQCTGEVDNIGYVGKRVCELSCVSTFYAKVCDGAVCRAPRETALQNSAYCMRVGSGTLLNIQNEYAWANGNNECYRTASALYCPRVTNITSLCSKVECTQFQCVWKDFETSCANGLCISDGHIVPYSPKHRLRRQLSGGGISLYRQGGSMLIASKTANPASTCELSAAGKRHSWGCNEMGCLKSLSLLEFSRGTHVAVKCGLDTEGFIWSYSGPAGFSTGVDSIDWALNVYTSLSIAMRLLIATLVMAVLQFVFYIFGGKSLLLLAWRSLKWVFKFLYNTRDFFRDFSRNTFWCLYKDRICKLCGADQNFVPHPAGCPFSPNKERCKQCPLTTETNLCEFPVVGSVVDMDIHWVSVHLRFYNLPFLMWANPLNWWKRSSVLNRRPELNRLLKDESQKVDNQDNQPLLGRRGFVLPKKALVMAVLCCMTTGVSPLTQVAGTSSCAEGNCTVKSTIIQEGLWMNDHSCYQVTSPDGNINFCIRGSALNVRNFASVTKCRADFQIKNWGIVACANGAGACKEYPGTLKPYENCSMVSDVDLKWAGWTDWGCGLPNVNSLCNKAYLVSTGNWDYCMASVESTSFDAGLCIIYNGETMCGNNSATLRGLAVNWTVQASATRSIPSKLHISRGGQVRQVVEENGCYGLYTENFGVEGCDNPVKGGAGACSYYVNHWWQISTTCQQSGLDSCEDPYDYAPLGGTCSVTRVEQAEDGAGFNIFSSGCTDGFYKAIMTIEGNVTAVAPAGKVESLQVSSCEGYSGSASGYSCIVAVRCSGNQLSCMLTSPVQAEIACGSYKRVFYSGSQNKTACFACSGVQSCIKNTGKKYAPRPEDPVYKKSSSAMILSKGLTWWGILLIVVGSLVVGFIMLSIFVCVTLRSINSKQKREI